MIFLSPADYVIHIFGGVRATARAIGRSATSVSNWRRTKASHGCNGDVPSAAQRLILSVAKKKNLDITPDDLIFGRRIERRKK